MKKAILIMPYYGTFPPYLITWLKSCAKNQNFDWLLISDETNKYIEEFLPSNVKFLSLSFNSMQEKVERVLGFNFENFTPYRLCDCRPLFGMIFEREIASYNFWGWCDADLIFGDLDSFITDSMLNSYDRIYDKGHLSLIRKSPQVDKVIRAMLNNPRVLEVYKSKHPQGFDEGLFNSIFKENQLRFYQKRECLDINARFYRFKNVIDGKEVRVKYIDGKITDQNAKEYVYVHYQKRSFENNEVHGNDFYISEKGFRTEIQDESRILMYIKDVYTYLNFLKKHLYPQYINKIKSLLK